jgi:hypothetical protein
MAQGNSRLKLATTAVRPKLKARIMLSAPSGGGKTWTALTIARELCKGDMTKVMVIDTEKDSALTYVDEFRMENGGSFLHLPWDAPYSPTDLAATMHDAGRSGFEVIITDSLTHFWTKSGGTLDLADARFGGWKTARPAQEEMVDAILGTTAHVIVCVRSKVEYTQVYNEKSRKQEVKKLGMAPQQDATLDYEMNIAVELDLEHHMFIGKSRTNDIPVGRVYAPGQAATFAAHYAEWLAGGTEVETTTLEALLARLNALPEPVMNRVKELWMERNLPKLADLNPGQVIRVLGIVDQVEAEWANMAPLAAPDGHAVQQTVQAPAMAAAGPADGPEQYYNHE